MFNAPPFVRVLSAVLSCALTALLVPAAPAQTIDISLNVFYDVPADINSGGTWEIVAKSSHSGIASLSLRLADIGAGVTFDAPQGTVNGSNGAGFWVVADAALSDHRNVSLAQAPLGPTDLEPGDEQSIFYGVGTIANGTPGAIGPTFTSLTNVQNVPWAPVPPGDAFADIAWNTAARFVSGTFAEGDTPEFFPGTTGQVLTTIGTSMTPGSIAPATVSTIVRTNSTFEGLPGDFNDDLKVDAADYVVWRKNNGTSTALPNDGGLGVPISTAHYDLWRNNFGAMPGSGAGAAAVPEPATGVLLALGLGLFGARPRRRIARAGRPISSNQHAATWR